MCQVQTKCLLPPSRFPIFEFLLCRNKIELLRPFAAPGGSRALWAPQVIHQLLRTSNKILVCTPSNVAADNIVEKLATAGKAVKVVQPSRAPDRCLRPLWAWLVGDREIKGDVPQ